MHITITGGTGSLGRALIQFLLPLGWRISTISRDPLHLAQLRADFPAVESHLCDIARSDAADRLSWLIAGSDVVVHTAALKHVGPGQNEPEEFMQVNVIGTLNVARACQNSCQYAIMISTDKAVEPINVYGKTKALAESLWLSHGPHFFVLRYGNVFDSQGSVAHAWRQAWLEGKPLIVRSPEPTRFFLLREGAVRFIWDVLSFLMADKVPGNIFIPNFAHLYAVSLWDMARHLAPPDRWQMQPLAPGEKVHEILAARHEVPVHETEQLIVLEQRGDQGSGPRYSSAEARLLPARTAWELLEGAGLWLRRNP